MCKYTDCRQLAMIWSSVKQSAIMLDRLEQFGRIVVDLTLEFQEPNMRSWFAD